MNDALWVVDGCDVHDLLTVDEAATIYYVTAAQIRHWRARGHLKPEGVDERGRHMFRGIDVLRAQAAAGRNRARTQASNLATRRASPNA